MSNNFGDKDALTYLLLNVFPALAKESITYNGETSIARSLYISPNIFATKSCPAGCGACCSNGTLDYIPDEHHPDNVIAKTIQVNSRDILVLSDNQKDNTSIWCRHLGLSDARCGIYSVRPLMCDLPWLGAKEEPKLNRWNFGLHQFARGFNYKQVNDYKDNFQVWNNTRSGVACGPRLEVTTESIANCRRKLCRLQLWINYFKIDNYMTEIVRWAEQEPYPTYPLILGKTSQKSLLKEA